MRARLAGVAMLATACAGAPEVPSDWFEAAGDDATTARFLDASAILSGFDEPTDGSVFRIGDRALYGLEFRDGGDAQRWSMMIEVVDPAVARDGEELLYIGTMTLTQEDGPSIVVPTVSQVVRLRVSRFDADGDPDQSTEIDVPRESLASGLAAGCAAFQGWPEDKVKPTYEELKTFSKTVSACRALFDVIEEDQLLSDILWQIARTPSVWSVLGNAGVEVSLGLKLDQAVVVADSPAPPCRTYRLPIEIQANDEPSLLVTADVAEPRSPWNVGAGVLALSAQRPGRDDVRLRVRLLAARRGPD